MKFPVVKHSTSMGIEKITFFLHQMIDKIRYLNTRSHINVNSDWWNLLRLLCHKCLFIYVGIRGELSLSCDEIMKFNRLLYWFGESIDCWSTTKVTATFCGRSSNLALRREKLPLLCLSSSTIELSQTMASSARNYSNPWFIVIHVLLCSHFYDAENIIIYL